MMQIVEHSQNRRGSLQHSSDWILSTLNDPNRECTAVLLQDIGMTGPDGPPSLRNPLGDHKILAHSSSNNKSRTVAIIIHKSWNVLDVRRDDTGSAIGVVVERKN